MDTVFQSFVAVFGSVVLAGCLTEPTITDVPDPVTEESTDANGADLAKLTPELPMGNPHFTPGAAGRDFQMVWRAIVEQPIHNRIVPQGCYGPLRCSALKERWAGTGRSTGNA